MKRHPEATGYDLFLMSLGIIAILSISGITAAELLANASIIWKDPALEAIYRE